MEGSSRSGSAVGWCGGDQRAPDARTPARFRTGVRLLPTTRPVTGSRRRSPPRWCSDYYCRSLHITSFRSFDPTRCAPRGQARFRQAARRERTSIGACRRLAPRTSSAGVEHRVVAGRRRRVGRPRRRARCPPCGSSVLSGVSHLAMVSRNAAAVVLELCPLLDRALAERLRPDQRRPAAVVQRARDDLGRRRGAAVDEDHELDRRVGRDARRAWRPSRSGCPSASCCQKIVPVGRGTRSRCRAPR